MYDFVTHTWNPIKGNCPHKCRYCYMKRWGDLGKPRLDEKCLKDNLGNGNIIFVGSSIDMFAKTIPTEWIQKVLDYCENFPKTNQYLFQSKNPGRFLDFIFPKNTILGTTLESDYYFNGCFSDSPNNRLASMYNIIHPKMISIEPITIFNLENFVWEIKKINPIFVSIGADSGHNNLPEPSAEKVKALISELKKFTEVKLKKNLDRLFTPVTFCHKLNLQGGGKEK